MCYHRGLSAHGCGFESPPSAFSLRACLIHTALTPNRDSYSLVSTLGYGLCALEIVVRFDFRRYSNNEQYLIAFYNHSVTTDSKIITSRGSWSPPRKSVFKSRVSYCPDTRQYKLMLYHYSCQDSGMINTVGCLPSDLGLNPRLGVYKNNLI